MSLAASNSTEVGETGVFGQVTGLVAATLGFATSARIWAATWPEARRSSASSSASSASSG